MSKTITAEKNKTAKNQKPKEKSQEGLVKEFIKTVVSAVLIATVFRTVFYEPFNIPSESMLPTLMTGDYLLVSKMSYGYSTFSLPFSPDLFSGRLIDGDVARGDIAVFKLPRDNSTDYIKRIIGLPGDRLQMRQGQLFINGEPVVKERVEDFVFTESSNINCLRYPNYRHPRGDGAVECRYPQYRETVPGGASYMSLDLEPYGLSDNTEVFIVPEGHYFAMGDNRDNSSDSRKPVSFGVGYVPKKNLVGRASIIFFSTNGDASLWEFWKWFSAARGDRMFTRLNSDD